MTVTTIDPSKDLLEQLMKHFHLTRKAKRECRILYKALWAVTAGFYEEAEKLREEIKRGE